MKTSTLGKKKHTGAMTKIGPKHQITIPQKVFEGLGLDVGDYLEVAVKENRILITPQKFLPKEDMWFYTPEWQAKEKEADEDIRKGRVSGPFSSSEELIVQLRRRKKDS